MPDRSWERGLHQFVEAKEGCDPTPRRETIARITYQRLFRRFIRLSGMTGTGKEVAGIRRVYGLDLVRIPLNRPSQRRYRRPRVCLTKTEKWRLIADTVETVALGAGRPILIGTRSVGASAEVSAILRERGIEHALLNAVQDREEAEIVARAGQPGAVTVATNMAGRGTDIRLGPGVAERGGLHVVLTSPESRRVDRRYLGGPGDGRTRQLRSGRISRGRDFHQQRAADDQSRPLACGARGAGSGLGVPGIAMAGTVGGGASGRGGAEVQSSRGSAAGPGAGVLRAREMSGPLRKTADLDGALSRYQLAVTQNPGWQKPGGWPVCWGGFGGWMRRSRPATGCWQSIRVLPQPCCGGRCRPGWTAPGGGGLSGPTADVAGSAEVVPGHGAMLRGNSLRYLGKPAGAVAAYDRAIELRPAVADAWIDRGEALRRAWRVCRCAGQLGTALKINLGHLRARNERSILLAVLSREAEAEAEARRVLAVDPHHADALNTLGVVLQRQGRSCRGDREFSGVDAMVGRPGFGTFNIALCLLITGDYARGLPSIQDKAADAGICCSATDRWPAAMDRRKRASPARRCCCTRNKDLAIRSSCAATRRWPPILVRG